MSIKIILAAAIAILSLASPACAQSFNRADGTGNEHPSYYDGQGGLHAGTSPQISDRGTSKRTVRVLQPSA